MYLLLLAGAWPALQLWQHLRMGICEDAAQTAVMTMPKLAVYVFAHPART
jgi:hypothetical protein